MSQMTPMIARSVLALTMLSACAAASQSPSPRGGPQVQAPQQQPAAKDPDAAVRPTDSAPPVSASQPSLANSQAPEPGANTSYQNSAPANERGVDIPSAVNAAASTVIAALTIALLAVASKQRDISDKQREIADLQRQAMDAQNTIMAGQTLLMDGQLRATEIAAVAAKTSADTSRHHMAITARSFVTQRTLKLIPTFVDVKHPTTGEVTSEEAFLVPGRIQRAVLYLVNNGHSIATIVSFEVRWGVLHGNRARDIVSGPLGAPHPGYRLLPGSQPFHLTPDEILEHIIHPAGALSPEQVAGINNETMALAYWGSIEYTDPVSPDIHVTRFAGVFSVFTGKLIQPPWRDALTMT